MKAKNLALTFTPLVLFSIAGHLVGAAVIGWAALVSAAIAVLVLITGLRQGVKMLTLASAVIFLGLAAVALFGGPTGRSLVTDYGTGVCALLIGLLMLASVATMPFTEQYARAEVPRQYWGSATFRAVNKRISLAWAGAVVGTGLSRLVYGILADATDHQVSTILRLGLTWGIPIVLVLGALNTTKKATADAGQATSTPQGPSVRPQ